MSERCFLGLDLGTTHVKCIALSPDGRVLASAERPVETRAPKPGRAEQDAEEVWEAASRVLRETASALGPESVEGLALSGAMHTCLAVAADASPLSPALTWADQRAAGICRRLRARLERKGLEALYRRTGCPLQPLYHLPKLRWWIEQAPEIAGRAALFVSLKDLVLHRLAGVWAADPSIGSATGLLDIQRCRWDPEALELAGIGPQRLPALASPLEPAGRLTGAAARATGLPSGLPLVLGASDGALANLGCGALTPGQVVITVGTSGAVRHWVAEPRLDPAQRTWCYLLAEGRWFAGGALNNAGLAVQWVRDSLYAEEPGSAGAAGQPDPPGRSPQSGASGFERLFAEAAQSPPGAAGLRCLPFFAGERSPYFRAEARAAFLGLSWEHGRGHLARAVLEAVALRLADVWDALGLASAAGSNPESGAEAGSSPAMAGSAPGAEAGSSAAKPVRSPTGRPAFAPPSEPARLTGGILRSPFWVQLCCDALGLPLAAVEAADASAVGAALVAQAALDPGMSLEKLAARIQPGRRWDPDPAQHRLYRRLLEEFRDLYRRFVDISSAGGYADGA
jgi:gluconokinase